MKTTLNLDDRLIEEARRLTGVEDNDALVHRALKELVARENAHVLSSFAGPSHELRPIPRRRFRIRP
jgi:Arc/MetJ family transcription regulator